MKKILRLISTIIILFAANLNIIACKNQQNIINQFYVLGDSLSDTGAGTFGQNQYLTNDEDSNFKHFQLDKPYYKNCWSNGKVASQLIAERFKIDFKSGWSFKINNKIYQKFGNNYAYGGEVADSSDSKLNINKTFDLFHQTQMLLSQHQLQKKDVIWIEIGANDIGNLVTKTDNIFINNKINNILTEEKKTIKLLLKNGAKKIIISDVPDLTLTPKIKKILHNNQDKLKNAHQICEKFQKNWKEMINDFKKEYKSFIFPYFLSKELANDMIDFKNKVIDGNIETSATKSIMFSNKKSYSYKPIFNIGVNENNLKKYFYFDEFHPGVWFHQQLAKHIIKLIEKILLIF